METGEKMKDMEDTFRDGYEINGAFKDGLRAVLETHVKPMLAEAFDEGCDQFWDHSTGMKKGPPQSGEAYAARVIASLTQEPRDV